jgi:serine/threonine-protein kinase haspin
MELLDGGRALASCPSLRGNQAVSIFEQVASGVAVAEEALHFEHRDLHDGNVLVKELPSEAVSTA